MNNWVRAKLQAFSSAECVLRPHRADTLRQVRSRQTRRRMKTEVLRSRRGRRGRRSCRGASAARSGTSTWAALASTS